MSKILQIAAREFIATVFTKAFVIGLLILPAIIGIGFLVGPRLFMGGNFAVAGELAIVDPTGQVTAELQAALTGGTREAQIADQVREGRADLATGVILQALRVAPRLTLVERPADPDLDQDKAWLRADGVAVPRLALAVIHGNAVTPRPGESDLGSYDLYVPANQDARAEIAVHQSLREAIVSARIRVRGLDRQAIDELVNVPRVQSLTVVEGGERETVGAFNFILPFSFMFLLFMGVMGSGQGLLTTTIEEKSSRVIEVLLSAVSPMQLMAGKLLGHMGISLIGLGLYIALGLLALTSFSMIGLLEPELIFYLFVFFLLSFFMIGSLMMAAGAAVNDMREAQSLMMPMMLIIMLPWFLWGPISRDPNSTLAVVMSMLPPINSFGMLLRMASTEPPPMWQVWLSIGIGAVAVVGAIWVAAKIFRIGLLMFGKPPNLATLARWVRAA
jgi:ABC-type Na+ efflux pump permease subunit